MDLCNIRITGRDKEYWLSQLQEFANKFNADKVSCVQFGKQDIRGGISITVVDKNHCVPCQKFFKSKDEMLGFVVGWLRTNMYFGEYLSDDE